MPSHCNNLAPTLSRFVAVQRAFREEWMKAREKDRAALKKAWRLLPELEALHRELKGDLAYRPFSYDHEKAREYGFSELTIEKHAAAQELIDAIYDRDPRFVIRGSDGAYDVDIVAVKAYWTTHCTDLPNIPRYSVRYLRDLAKHRLSTTTDNDDPRNLTNPTIPHIPLFGDKEFMLIMDFSEYDWRNTAQRNAALTHQTRKLLKELFDKENPQCISRDTVNTVLWAHHDTRVQSDKAKAVVRTLLGSTANPDDYELRLMRPDEYQRVAHTKNFGAHNQWTHLDGYNVWDDGYHGGLYIGKHDSGGAAVVFGDYCSNRFDNRIVRLVLVRRT